MKKPLFLSFLISLILLGGCSLVEDKQVDDDKIDEGEVLETKDQELSFSIFQIVSIDLGETTFSDGQIVGTTLEGEKIDLFIEDNFLTFMVPKLNQGDYKLVFSGINKPFNIPFNVKPHVLKETPSSYLESYWLKSQEQIASLEKSKSFLTEDKQAALDKDIATLKQKYQAHFAEAALLNEAELADMAFFFNANDEWLGGLLNVAFEFNSSLPDARMLQEQVVNIEQEGGKSSENFLLAKGKIILFLRALAGASKVGGYSGNKLIKNPKGAEVGAGVAFLITYNYLINLWTSFDKKVNYVGIIADSNIQTNINLRAENIFENGKISELLVYRNYRTITSGDKDSNIPLVKDFFLGHQELLKAWRKLEAKISFNLLYKPIDPLLKETSESKLLQVHSDHLNFSGITNPKVTGSAKKEYGKLFLTFNTSETDAQEFDFKLIYDNQDFGKLEKTLDAAVINSDCNVMLELTDKNVLTATATGYGPFKFVWTSGQNATESKTHVIKAAKFGYYSVTVIDQNDCESQATLNVPCTLKIDVQNSANTYTIEALDGLPPYNYTWSTGGATKSQTLPPGSHTVTIRDGLGCEILYTINIGCDLAVSVKKDGNTVTAQATGGTSPYTYTWSNGSTTASQTNLTPGTYSVVVMDKVGCEKSASVTISCDLAVNIQKEGNKVTAQPAGGTAPYTYTWSNGATTASQSNLASGTYTVVVKDQLGCEKSASVTIEFSSTKELTSFSFNQELNDILVKGEGVIDNSIVTIFLPSGTKRNALIPTFVISNRAKAYVNNVEIITNSSLMDFSSEKVILKIVAEDQSSQEYEINLITEFPEIDNRILAFMTSMNIPGAQVAITKNEKLVYLKSYGLADKENNISVANNSLFRIASVSKPITQAAILQLVQSGKLSLDGKVFGPDGILKSTYGTKPYSDQLKSITVRHLVEHKAGGWPNDSQDPMGLPYNWTHTELINFVLDNRPLQAQPGSTYLYSNFGYLLLGRIIDVISGESYENHVKKSLLSPAGITEMKLGNGTLDGKFANEVKYYNDQFNPYSVNNVKRLDAAGGWIASAKDLAKLFVRIDRNTQVPDLVQKSLLDETYFKFFNWLHFGSLSGTSAHLERLNNEFGIIILGNGSRGADLGKVVREGMSERQIWPVYDLMNK